MLSRRFLLLMGFQFVYSLQWLYDNYPRGKLHDAQCNDLLVASHLYYLQARRTSCFKP